MENKIKSFMFYKNYYLLLKLLPKEEREKISLSILEYMFEDLEPIFDEESILYAVWEILKKGIHYER